MGDVSTERARRTRTKREVSSRRGEVTMQVTIQSAEAGMRRATEGCSCGWGERRKEGRKQGQEK